MAHRRARTVTTVESRSTQSSHTRDSPLFLVVRQQCCRQILHQSGHWFIQSYLVQGAASQEVVPTAAFARAAPVQTATMAFFEL
jgi:hypothetical protein